MTDAERYGAEGLSMSSTRGRRIAKRSIAVGATGLTLGLAGWAGAVAMPALNPGQTPSSSDVSPVSFAPAVSASGPGEAASTAIQQVMSAIHGYGLASAVLTDPPAGIDGSSGVDPSARWLHLTFHGDLSRPGSDMLYTWYGALAQGAIADEVRGSEDSTNQVIGGSDVDVVTPDGSTVDLGGSAGDVVAGQSFEADGATAVEEKSYTSQIDAGLSGLGLVPGSVDYVHVSGTAVQVVATYAGVGPVSWTNDELRDAVVGSPSRYDGFYIEIDDPSGNPLYITEAAYRTGLGGEWFAPGEEGVFGADSATGGIAPPLPEPSASTP